MTQNAKISSLFYLRKLSEYSLTVYYSTTIKVCCANPYRVIQMKPQDFKDYSVTTKLFNYKLVPFLKISVLKFTQVSLIIHFKIYP